jgi:hypothetical protein
MDNTMKIAAKATVVDKTGTHLKLMKGGVLSAVNESNLIVAWVSNRKQQTSIHEQHLTFSSRGFARARHLQRSKKCSMHLKNDAKNWVCRFRRWWSSTIVALLKTSSSGHCLRPTCVWTSSISLTGQSA